MKITHEINTSIINVTSNTSGFDITTNCQAIFFVNTGADAAKIYFNNEANYYELEAGGMLTIDVNSDNEIITDIIKVVFTSAKQMNLRIQKQIKKLII